MAETEQGRESTITQRWVIVSSLLVSTIERAVCGPQQQNAAASTTTSAKAGTTFLAAMVAFETARVPDRLAEVQQGTPLSAAGIKGVFQLPVSFFLAQRAGTSAVVTIASARDV